MFRFILSNNKKNFLFYVVVLLRFCLIFFKYSGNFTTTSLLTILDRHGSNTLLASRTNFLVPNVETWGIYSATVTKKRIMKLSSEVLWCSYWACHFYWENYLKNTKNLLFLSFRLKLKTIKMNIHAIFIVLVWSIVHLANRVDCGKLTLT